MQIPSSNFEHLPVSNFSLGKKNVALLSFIILFSSIAITYWCNYLLQRDIVENLTWENSGSLNTFEYSSLITFSFLLGQFLSAFMWGIFIDKYGRKTGLLISLSAVIFLTVLFGLSTTYKTAIVIQFITGIFSGVLVIGRTLSTEICSDNMKSWSIPLFTFFWEFGIVIGPLIGEKLYYRQKLPYYESDSKSFIHCVLGIASLGLLSYFFIWKSFKEPFLALLRQQPVNSFQQLENIVEEDENQNGVRPYEVRSRIGELTKILKIPNTVKIAFIYTISIFLSHYYTRILWMQMSSKGSIYKVKGHQFSYDYIIAIMDPKDYI